jgi:NADP-dependent 3-hydroxy acid dehydrogenase YdfG
LRRARLRRDRRGVDARREFETNVFGLARMCQLVLPGMRRQGFGRIVNISSMGGRMTLPGGGSYHATKYAVEASAPPGSPDAQFRQVLKQQICVACSAIAASMR